MQCAKHPNIETNLACGKCGKPICTKCMVQTPVGIRCKDCAKLKSLPTYQVSSSYYFRAVGAGIGIALVGGFIWMAVNLILPFFFLRLFIAAGIGYGIGEVISLAVNRKHSTGLAIIGGASAALSFVIANVIFTSWFNLSSILISLFVLAIAVFIAITRLR